MSKSPIQIVENFYPLFSYEANPGADASKFALNTPVTFTAGVQFEDDGLHIARIILEQDSLNEELPYTLMVHSFASFRFDLQQAKKFYGEGIVFGLAVNVLSILFSSTREAIANATARGPYGPVYVEGVVLEPSNVDISFDKDPHDLVPKLFGISPPAQEDVEIMKQEGLLDGSDRGKKKGKRAGKQKR